MKTTRVSCLVVTSLLFSITADTALARGGRGVKYAISSSAGTNGKIKPTGTKQARAGTSKTYVATPVTGYRASILLDAQVVATGTISRPLSYTLGDINAPHAIRAEFALPTPTPAPTPAGSVSSISIIGFGNTNTVTNQTPVTISGIAESSNGVSNVQGVNVTTNTNITVTGTTGWSTSAALNVGDNLLRFTVHGTDGSQAQIETTITYYPTLDFTTKLEASHTILFTDTSTNVNFTIGIKNTSGATVKLFQANAQGGLVDSGMQMFDNGGLPDEIQADGVFTVGLTLSTTTPGFLYFRAGVIRNGSTFYSEVFRIWITGHFVNGQIDTAVNLANDVGQMIDTALQQGQTQSQASTAALNALKTNPSVGAAGVTPENEVWWVSQDGILEFNDVPQASQRSGDTPAGPRIDSLADLRGQLAGQAATGSIPHQIRYYKDRDVPNPSDNAMRQTAAIANENRIRSRKGILVSPFINNPNSQNNFGMTDDYFGPWQVVKAAGINSCKLYDAAEYLNNGSVVVSLASFSNMSDFGYIHFCTHGDNFYNGLFSAWKDVWGPSDFLKGSLSQVILVSGIYLPKNPDGSWNITGFEEDLKAHRIAIRQNGGIALLPGFFSAYLSDLPNSLVILGSCRSTYNASLVSVFLNYGAGAVIGFTDYVNSVYAQNTVKTVLQDLYMDKTVLEGAVDAVTQFGQSDADKTPAFFTLYGAADLKLAGPDLQNGGFEEGTLSSWSPDGDGRVIRQLGSTLPTEGSFMGIISTGLGFTTSSGSIRQDFCVPANATTLNFDWNFFSEEFLEYCGSGFQDFFAVTLYELDSNGIPINSHPLFHRKIDELCGQVHPSDVGFDKNGVYNTGWLTNHVDVSAYKGEHVIIEFSAGDIGDSIYDTAILLDNISISTSTP